MILLFLFSSSWLRLLPLLLLFWSSNTTATHDDAGMPVCRYVGIY
jgi:hypothetical protein